MNFASDNWAGVHQQIASRLAQEATGFAAAYGDSHLDKKVELLFNELFEREVAVFFVATGTAANALALASVNRPGGVSFCHREAHMLEDECGAPEFFTHGARLAPVDGINGKIDAAKLSSEIARFPPDFVHAGQPMAVSITQATEIGTVYTIQEITALAKIAHSHDLPLHMDGARLANALVSLDVTAAEMTWQAGVDIISFGATKNGCWCAEALVFTDPKMAHDFAFIRKRAAQLFSKTRFIACQFDAYLNNGLWLELARHANTMAERLRQGIHDSQNAHIAWKTESNEVFCVLHTTLAKQLMQNGVNFHRWNLPRDKQGLIDESETLIRLVASFATTPREVDEFVDLLM